MAKYFFFSNLFFKLLFRIIYNIIIHFIRIGIYCTASATPEDSGAYYVDMFVNVYGAASATYIPVTENRYRVLKFKKIGCFNIKLLFKKNSNNADDPAIAALVQEFFAFNFNIEK